MSLSLLVRTLRIAVLLSSIAAAPALAVEGRVVLQGDGTPVADADVAIIGHPGSFRTDRDGRFVWTPTPTPPFEVLVTLPGGRYVPIIRVETLPDSGPVLLEVVWRATEAVTVTSGAAPTLEGTAANGITLLSGEELQARAPSNLSQALENVAGAASVSEGHAGVPALRGLARGRTLVLIDGARVSAERRVGPSATYLDPASVEGVEVLRGPGSVAYGSDAFGGVLQVRTRHARPGAPLGGRVEGTLGAGVPQQRLLAEVSRGFTRGGVLVQAHYRNFDDWTSPEGEVFNSGAQDRGFLIRLDNELAGGLLSVGLQSDFGRDIERPRSNSRTVRFFYPTEDSHRCTLGWERGSLGAWNRVGASAFLGSYSVVTDQDRFATPSRPRSVERADVSARDFHLRGYAERPLGRVRLETGVDVHGRFGLRALDIGLSYDAAGSLARSTENVSIDRARRIDAGLFASLEAPVGAKLQLGGGLRADRVASRNRGGHFGDRSVTSDAWSGFASATAGPWDGLTATLQVARGFRDPVLSDRYFRGPTGRGFITGNPDLEPERSLQFDAALRYSRGRYRTALYGYSYRIDDLVERYQTETDFFFFRNRGRAQIRGIEAEVQALLPARFSLELTGHLIRGRALDDDTTLDDVPPETLTARVQRQFPRGSAWLRTALYGRLSRPGPTELERAGYGILDAGGSFRATEKLELNLVGRNLLDKAHLVSPDSRAVLAAGRSVLLTASFTF